MSNQDTSEPVVPAATVRQARWPWVAAALSGAVLATAYPTWDVSAAMWLWMFPLLAALWIPAPCRKRRAFLLGWISGFVFHFLVLRWLRDIFNAGPVLSPIGWFALSAYLACYTGAWAVFASTTGRLVRGKLFSAAPDAQSDKEQVGKLSGGFAFVGLWPGTGAAQASLHAIAMAAANAAAWVFLEWLRGWLLSGFGWNGLGTAMHTNAAMIQVAEITGASGLAFLPVFVSICLFSSVWRIHQKMRGGARRASLNLEFAAAMLLLVVWFLFGAAKLVATRKAAATTIEVAVIQRNISQEEKWQVDLASSHIQGYYNAFAQAMAKRADERESKVEKAMGESGEVAINLDPPDLILMPESALPAYLADPVVEEFRAELLKLAGPKSVLVTGINDAEPGEKPLYFNTIAILDASETAPVTYRKRNLVPFGEFLPLRSIPLVETLLGDVLPEDFTPGKSTEPLSVATRHGSIGIIPAICFEDTLGRHTRLFIRSGGPQVIINTTNDGWFKDPAAALQHAANAKLRCVETRRPMVRAANTGLSCVIDATGVVTSEIRDSATGSPQMAEVMMAPLSLDPTPPVTFHSRFGDVFSWACGAVALWLVGFTGLGRKFK